MWGAAGQGGTWYHSPNQPLPPWCAPTGLVAPALRRCCRQGQRQGLYPGVGRPPASAPAVPTPSAGPSVGSAPDSVDHLQVPQPPPHLPFHHTCARTGLGVAQPQCTDAGQHLQLKHAATFGSTPFVGCLGHLWRCNRLITGGKALRFVFEELIVTLFLACSHMPPPPFQLFTNPRPATWKPGTQPTPEGFVTTYSRVGEQKPER